MRLTFQGGTIEISECPRGEMDEELPHCVWDARSASWRAPAHRYAALIRALVGQKRAFVDGARSYSELALSQRIERTPRPFQREALAAWKRAKGQGVVVLPTGSGKSQLGIMAILDRQRSTLVVAPTLDLVRQWHDQLKLTFDVPIGMLGGGEHEVLDITVSTYDSAALHMQHIGNRFGFLIFDECHHLPSPTYSLAARLSLAPYRLGLTATPVVEADRVDLMRELTGEVVYEKAITDLSGSYLADYETERVMVRLSEAERAEYEAERAVYTAFLRKHGISLRDRSGFTEFIKRSARGADGARAMEAYRRQRQLALGSSAKLAYLEHLLELHAGQKMLVFTHDTPTAYEISRRFLIPTITHQTKLRERSFILSEFSGGVYDTVVTAKVLNEGVDVPEASVAVVFGGSGSVREHVQRLGRILRKQDGKRAILYELISENTGEGFTSERRRDHVAYQS